MPDFHATHERSGHRLNWDNLRSRKHRKMVIFMQQQHLPGNEASFVRNRTYSKPYSTPIDPSMVHPQRFSWCRTHSNPEATSGQSPDCQDPPGGKEVPEYATQLPKKTQMHCI